MNSALFRFGLWIVAALAFLYSAVVILVAIAGFVPALCQVNPVCGAVRIPKERLGVSLLVGVNSGVVGNIWWVVAWAAGAIGGSYEMGRGLVILSRTATRLKWFFWFTAGAMLLLPLLLLLFFLGVFVVGWVLLGIPVLIHMIFR